MVIKKTKPLSFTFEENAQLVFSKTDHELWYKRALLLDQMITYKKKISS